MIKKSIYPFHLMIKPIGAACNLACAYCYYLDKSETYGGAPARMDNETLERVTSAYLKFHPGPEVVFGWQGGEPLLMGLEFFERALELQSKYARPDQQVSNTLQTNGVLVDDKWAEFFARHNFLIGVSIDGPPDLHDRHRRDRGGKPSHSRVVAGIRALQRRGVATNALVTVNRTNVEFPLRVYFYLKELGVKYLQFIPIVERKSRDSNEVTDSSVPADGYGTFLSTVFDYWSQFDIGRVFVQQFESAVSAWAGFAPSVCVFAPTCGRSLVVERNGDLYACDHFVYPSTFETLLLLRRSKGFLKVRCSVHSVNQRLIFPLSALGVRSSLFVAAIARSIASKWLRMGRRSVIYVHLTGSFSRTVLLV